VGLALLLTVGIVVAPSLEGSRMGDRASDSTHGQPCCPVLELRQYTLHPGKRDVLIELFDREFVESQEAEGMQIVGQFRDLGDPNRFVWLRGFRDMPTRAKALTAFYGGPVWKAHRQAANETMIDCDNVLLLRPAREGSGFSLGSAERPSRGAVAPAGGLVIATIYDLEAGAEGDFVDFFEGRLEPALSDAGASIVGYFVTEPSANTYPALPVREGENVFVWFSRFRDQAAYERYIAALAGSPRWGGDVTKDLARRLKGHPETLKLSPTGRSKLR
jgi:quinol monooxygenase YgiN